LPVPRGGRDVVEAHDRPEPLAGVGVLMPGDRLLVAELGQRALHVVAQPEVHAGQVDLVQGKRRGRGGHGAHGGLLARGQRLASATLCQDTPGGRRAICGSWWTGRSARPTPSPPASCPPSSTSTTPPTYP